MKGDNVKKGDYIMVRSKAIPKIERVAIIIAEVEGKASVRFFDGFWPIEEIVELKVEARPLTEKENDVVSTFKSVYDAISDSIHQQTRALQIATDRMVTSVEGDKDALLNEITYVIDNPVEDTEDLVIEGKELEASPVKS